MAEGSNWKAAALSACTALLLAFGGCGDSDDEGSEGSVETDARAEFIAAADAICTDSAGDLDAEAQQVIEEANGAPTNDELVAFFTEVTLPALQAQVDEIDALTPPEGEEEQVQAIVDAANAAIAESEKDPQLLLVPQGNATPFDEANQLAQDFGLQVCGAGDPDAGQPSS